jgi:hypothetical protein
MLRISLLNMAVAGGGFKKPSVAPLGAMRGKENRRRATQPASWNHPDNTRVRKLGMSPANH